jgi:hypothetical protein
MALLVSSIVLALVALVVGSARVAAARKVGPFVLAAAAGLAANVALLALSGKALFGHYVQPLVPFYFVVYAELGRWSWDHTGWRRALVGALSAAFAIGGVDATLRVSRTLDARNGLRAVRAVIEAVRADAPNERSVALDFDFVASTGTYDLLASRQYPNAPHFDGGQRAYRLVLTRSPAPPASQSLVEAEPVTLYRVR